MSKYIQIFVIVLFFSIGVFAGTAQAWSAIWHSPAGWVVDGAAIQADKLGETLQYLYERVTFGPQDTLKNLNCGTGQIVTWGGSSWVCSADCVPPPPPPPPGPIK